MVKDTLDLVERWGLAIEITDNEISVDLSAFLIDRVRYENSRTTCFRNCGRGKSF